MKAAIIVILIAMHIAYCVSEQINSANLKQLKYSEGLVELFYIYNLILVIRILYKENGRRLSEVWYSSMLLYVSNILFAGGILCYFTFICEAKLVSLYHAIFNVVLGGNSDSLQRCDDCVELSSDSAVVDHAQAEPTPSRTRSSHRPVALERLLLQ